MPLQFGPAMAASIAGDRRQARSDLLLDFVCQNDRAEMLSVNGMKGISDCVEAK